MNLRRVLVTISVAGLLAALAVACEEEEKKTELPATATVAVKATDTPPPLPTDTPLPSEPTTLPVSQQDAAAIGSVVRDFFAAYNEGNMVRATGYVTSDADRDCGGATNHAFAYTQLQRMEQLRYEVVEVQVGEVVGDTAAADVTINSFDTGSGKQVDEGLALGFQFIRDTFGDWVFDSDPLWIASFCNH